jgi:uncharacterized membrane protein
MFDALQQAFPSLFIRFLIYGLIGWCVEVLFTGLSSAVFQRDRTLTGKTYLWMHPVWGLTCLALEQLQDLLVQEHRLVRALIYVGVIYLSEFSSGWVLRKTIGKCPWDYTGKGFNVMGLIRLDYAPAWMLAALAYEPMRIVVGAFANPRTIAFLSEQMVALR